MSEHDTQYHLVQHIIASFLFVGLNTFSDLLETELVALPGGRAWVGEGGSLPMGHLKQLEYGGKKLGSKIVQRQQSLQFWSGCCKRTVCNNNIAAEDMRARARHWRRRRRPPYNARRSNATAPTDVYAPVHILCWKMHIGAHSAHVGALCLPCREPYSAGFWKW